MGVGSSLTSQQQNVVANYIQQKTKVVAGNAQSFFAKRAVTNPQQYYCDVCKISCACAAVSGLWRMIAGPISLQYVLFL